MTIKPTVFIGSSSEGLTVAETFQVALERAIPSETTVWHQGIFDVGSYQLDALVRSAQHSDFAVLVLSPDDTTESRGNTVAAPRDNVIFELGLFMGALSPERVFILCPESPLVKLPSDLSGITRLPVYGDRSDNNLHAALGPAVVAAREAIKVRGRRATHHDRSIGTDGAPLNPDSQDERLEMEILWLFTSASAQGWRPRRTHTTLRMTSPKGSKFSCPLTEDAALARQELRQFVKVLRARGLRVNGRLRNHAA